MYKVMEHLVAQECML